MNNLKKAKVKENGKLIEVYQHRISGNWIDYHDCNEEYKTFELEFLS